MDSSSLLSALLSSAVTLALFLPGSFPDNVNKHESWFEKYFYEMWEIFLRNVNNRFPANGISLSALSMWTMYFYEMWTKYFYEMWTMDFWKMWTLDFWKWNFSLSVISVTSYFAVAFNLQATHWKPSASASASASFKHPEKFSEIHCWNTILF